MSVGLDIGSRSIKIVELARSGPGWSLRSAGAVGYSGPAIEANLNDTKAIADLAGVLKKLAHDTKISNHDVAIALPETQVFTRLMQFPLLTDAEIASAVKWEAEEYVPIPIKDAIIEHQVLERLEGANPPQVLVLLIAVLKSLVENYVDVAGKAGLNVVGVETELISMTRALSPEGKSVLIVDFGARSTDIAIVKNGQLYFSRSVPTAGEAFTRAVAQSLGVSVQQAEEYKRTYGLSENQLEGKVGRALAPIFKVVAGEIKKAIHYYQLNIKGETPTMVIIAGGSAGLPGAAPMLTNLLGMEVVIGTPFGKIKLDPDAARGLANYAPLYSVAAGLAMRGD
jgi:type IV pilus assembly protein PilM